MLILIAHGSRDPGWRGSVEELTASLRAELGAERVRLAYMQCTPPTLMDAATEAARAGVKKIRVLPLFLTEQGHVDRTIRPLVEQVRRAIEPVEVQLLPPVGSHPLFFELLRKIAVDV